MQETLDLLLKVSIATFMVASLLAMGLELAPRAALAGLRDGRFVVVSLLCCFVLGPAIACLIAAVVPMDRAYAKGLVLLGMAPSAPFLPACVRKVGGDMGYAAAFLMLASVGTVVLMPLAVPVLVDGLTADAWTIAKPLVLLVLAPLAVGMAVRSAAPAAATRIHKAVSAVAAVATLVLLVLCVLLYGEGFVGAVGSYAIGAQMVFFSAITFSAYALAFGMAPERRSVVALGTCTRNLGAALAPLFATADVDQRSIVMVALGVPMQLLAVFLASRCLRGDPSPAGG